jgi:hypothetical protein
MQDLSFGQGMIEHRPALMPPLFDIGSGVHDDAMAELFPFG